MKIEDINEEWGLMQDLIAICGRVLVNADDEMKQRVERIMSRYVMPSLEILSENVKKIKENDALKKKLDCS